MDAKICINTYSFHEFFALPRKSALDAKISIVKCENSPFEKVKEWLETSELDRYHSFGSEKRRHQYVIGRIAAKNAIMKLIDVRDPTQIDISNAKDGHPITENAEISITHSNNYAAPIAYSTESTFGIDIERINEQRIKTLSYISLENEQIKQNPTQLTIAWCMKESLSKALLCGFSQPFETFRIKSLQQLANNDATYYATFAHYPQYKCIAKIIDPTKNIVVAVTYMDHTIEKSIYI